MSLRYTQLWTAEIITLVEFYGKFLKKDNYTLFDPSLLNLTVTFPRKFSKQEGDLPSQKSRSNEGSPVGSFSSKAHEFYPAALYIRIATLVHWR